MGGREGGREVEEQPAGKHGGWRLCGAAGAAGSANRLKHKTSARDQQAAANVAHSRRQHVLGDCAEQQQDDTDSANVWLTICRATLCCVLCRAVLWLTGCVPVGT